jgi:hypothetical protein
MCFDYHERLAWIRRMEEMERKLKAAELAKAEAARKKSEEQQAVSPPGTKEPVPA